MAVTDSEVSSAIADGAHTREAVTKACRAGGDCGACHSMIETMIEDHLEAHGCQHGCCGAKADGEAERQPGLVAAQALVRGRAA